MSGVVRGSQLWSIIVNYSHLFSYSHLGECTIQVIRF
jgi:hypothetical protein